MDKIEKIIEKYDKEIKDEFEKLSKIFSKYLKDNRAKYRNIFERMYSFYIITQYISQNINYGFDNLEKEILGIVTKIKLNFWAIYACLRNGAMAEAGIIQRSMLESVVTLEIILKENTRERLKLFANFKHIKRWKHILNHKDLDERFAEKYLEKGPSKKYVQFCEKKFNEFKNDYNPKRPEHSWYWKEFKDKSNNPSIKFLFDDLGPEYSREYFSIYSTHSNMIHGGSLNTDYYSKMINDDESILVNSPKFDNSIISIGVTSMELCSRSLISYLRYFKFENMEGLDRYIEYFLYVAVDKFTKEKNSSSST